MTPAEAIDDTRRSNRVASTALLTYFPFTSRKKRSIVVHVLNCSPDGLCFRSPCRLRAGQTICLRSPSAKGHGHPGRPDGGILRSFALAEVRWCRNDGGCTIGVRYLQSK
jgi:hypothetical protein